MLAAAESLGTAGVKLSLKIVCGSQTLFLPRHHPKEPTNTSRPVSKYTPLGLRAEVSTLVYQQPSKLPVFMLDRRGSPCSSSTRQAEPRKRQSGA